ncbi:MAG TPA: histidine kinase, partial [Holophagaceae bacterium]|nr:histidine kinase [Holophagaceae bacterium]
MRSPQLTSALARRVRRPWLWTGVLGLGALWAALRLSLPVPFGRYGLWEAWLPLLLLVPALLLSPLPWQWTGDDRPLAPPARGLGQALIFNGVWIAALLLALDASHPPRPLPPPPGPPPLEGRRPGPPPLSLDLFHGSTALVMALLLGWLLAEREAEELRARAADTLAAQARTQALQAQLHPHALFNAISGLTELVHEDPEAAEAALLTLSDFLRLLMRQGGRPLAPLREERALLELQLRLAELRLGPRLEAEWRWPDWADGLDVPPLLLQPLVENAIRHGVAKRTMGGILRIGVTKE